MIFRDQVGRQGPMIVRQGFVEKDDAVTDSLARQKYQNVFLVGSSDAETIQLQIVSEQEFHILQCQEGPTVQPLSNERIKFPCQSVLDALGSAGFRLYETPEFNVVDPFQQTVIDVDWLAEAFSVRRAGFVEINSFVTILALLSTEDNVQVPSRRHFELLPKLRIDFVTG
jgi:hypothetical protein